MALRISEAEGSWQLAGELDRQEATSILQWSEQFPTYAGSLHLELMELDVSDGAAAAMAIDMVRNLLQRCDSLVLHHAPHTLAHTLYRIGMLEAGSRLTLQAPREEEPYG